MRTRQDKTPKLYRHQLLFSSWFFHLLMLGQTYNFTPTLIITEHLHNSSINY